MHRLAPLALLTLACGNPAPLSIHIQGSTAAFVHEDGYAGQTPHSARGGIRSLSLLRDADDKAPLELFNHGAQSVEVGFNDGDDTEVAVSQVPLTGRYTLARMVQTHSRYVVDACAHAAGSAVDGTLEQLRVMSDGTSIDGKMHHAGHHQSTFRGGDVVQETTGEDLTVPQWSSTAGAWAVVENGEWAVYFPVNLDVDERSPPTSMTVVVNLDHAFRWEDSAAEGYRANTWDLTVATQETVMRFGGNRFDVTLR